MRKGMSVLLAGLLIITVTSTIQPSGADENGEPTSIGRYLRVTENELGPDHVSWAGDQLQIEGPLASTKLKIRLDYLSSELEAWATDEQFTPSEGTADFEGGQARFFPLQLGPQSVFTRGHDDQIRFPERPMWVAAEQQSWGGPITLQIHDGDSTGQDIFVAKSWLWDRGIHRPNATHEDGTSLPAVEAEEGPGWTINVHHFSEIIINPADLEVKGRQNGVPFPHLGERRWFSNETRLEIDVGQQVAPYEVLVEADWVDLNLLIPFLVDHEMTRTEVQGNDYYSVVLAPEATPTTLVYTVLDCEPDGQTDPDECPPFVPDLYAQLDVPGDLYFAQFSLTVEELDARVADNPTVPTLVRTPQGIAIRQVWQVVYDYLYGLAEGLSEGETNGVLWIAPAGMIMPAEALLCTEEQQADGDPGNQMTGYDILFCAAEMKHSIVEYCDGLALAEIPPLDLGDVAEEWGLDPTGEVYDVLDAVSQPCEVLGYIFAWTDLHYLAAAYYLEFTEGSSNHPWLTVLPMQPYRGKWATAGGTRKAMEKMELTFATASVQFEDTKAPVKFPSGWIQDTREGLRYFSANYDHDFNGVLSALMVLRFGRVTLDSGDKANGVVGARGGATDGWMTTGSWGYANIGWGAHARNLWTSHEAGHLFNAEHSDTGCWGGTPHQHGQHQSIMGATSDDDGKPDHCDDWTRAHFHMTFTIAEIRKLRPHACSIGVGTECSNQSN